MALMTIAAGATLVLAAYPGDQPPADMFAAVCSGQETVFAQHKVVSRPWTSRIVLDLRNTRFCLADCTAWRPIARFEDSGARLTDSKTENSFFGWKAGRLHYRWGNLEPIKDPYLSDRQAYCIVEQVRE